MTSRPERLAMFPLGSVVFPYSGVPLRVFEPRYLRLFEDVVSGDRMFGTVLIERGFEVGGGDVRTDIGTRVRIIAHQDLDGGHKAVVVAGVERIRVLEWLPDDPHPWAMVAPMPDPPDLVDDLREAVRTRLDRVLALASELGADVAAIDVAVSRDPVAASYQYASMIPVTPLDSFRLLRAEGPRRRMELAIEMLDEQTELIRSRLEDP